MVLLCSLWVNETWSRWLVVIINLSISVANAWADMLLMYWMKGIPVAVSFESTVFIFSSCLVCALASSWWGRESSPLFMFFLSQASWSCCFVRIGIRNCPTPWVNILENTDHAASTRWEFDKLLPSPHPPILSLRWTWLNVLHVYLTVSFLGK